jgi:hypothetical protein
MHLTTANCAEYGVAVCVQNWLLRSTTAFYQAGDWHLPWYFGLLCGSYAISGLVVYMTATQQQRPPLVPTTTSGGGKAIAVAAAVDRFFPRTFYAFYLIFIQGKVFFVRPFLLGRGKKSNRRPMPIVLLRQRLLLLSLSSLNSRL